MKKEARYEYWLLQSLENDLPRQLELTTSLCAWCRFASWNGSCADAELDCQHKLEVVAERSFEVWQGDDCWGFRPYLSREDAVDICGLYLQGHHADWSTVKRLGRKKSKRTPAPPAALDDVSASIPEGDMLAAGRKEAE